MVDSRAHTATADLCSADGSQLVVVDFQTKLAAAIPDDVRSRVLHQIQVLLKAAAAIGVPVLVTEQYPQGLGPTESAISSLFPPGLQRFDKTRFSCCGANGFLPALAQGGRPQVVLAGMETHVCVLQTAFELRQLGYQVFVVEDAVCSRKKEHFRNAIGRLRQAGVTVSNTESVLFEWLRDAQHARFREISALLR